MVMLHGNPTWSFYYRNLVRSLRDSHRVIVPDHIGCGLSDKPDDSRYDYTLARRVDDLEALLDHLGLKGNLTLVLHDWGGMIGMAYASRYPERIARLVLLNTGAFLKPPGKRLPLSLWLGRNTAVGAWLIRGLNAFSRCALRWCARKPLPEAVQAGYLAPYDCWANRIAVLRFVQDIPLHPRDPQLRPGPASGGAVASFSPDTDLDLLGRARFRVRSALPGGVAAALAASGGPSLRRRWPLRAGGRRRGDPAAGAGVPGRCREPSGTPAIPFGNRGSGSARRTYLGECHGQHRQPPPRPGPIAPTDPGPDRTARPGPAGRFRYRHLTYQELDRESDILARGLQHLGITRGTRTVLMVPPGLEFFALTFALFKLGAVIVLIDPGMGLKNLSVCLSEAEPEAFIGGPKAHLARVLLRWARSTLRQWVTVGPRLGWNGVTLNQVRRLGRPTGPPVLADTRSDELAAILFTSGSTGVAKGAIYTHGIFAAQVEMLRRMYGIEPGEIDLPTFPLFGLFAPALGMTAIIPEMDPTRPAQVDPEKILQTIQHFGVTNLFGSPALIQRVGRYGAARGVQLPTLRRVISAGAPVPARAIECFCRLLPEGVQVHTPYGATEALPVASIGSAELLTQTRQRTAEGAGVCVGRPVEGATVRIIRISDEPIPTWSDDLLVPPGVIGEITVQGAMVTQAYYNRPEATRLAKISASGGIIHRMGDVGYLDEQGRLWFCGRKSQRVVTPKETFFTIPCEAVFNVHPAVLRSALVGVRRNGITEPVLCVERDPEGPPLSDEQLRRDLLELGASRPHTRAIRTILFHPGFPVDIRHNSKIFREKLAEWAQRR